MSSGVPSEASTPRQQPSVFLSTAIALGICLFFAVILWFVGGKSLFEARQLADANEKKVEEVSAELSKAENRNQQTQTAVAAIQEKLDSSTISSEQLDELLNRLKDLESGRANQEEALRALSQQASAVEGDRARNRVQVINAVKMGRNVETELAELENEITAWTGANAALPKGESGRKIAAFPDYITKYIALSEAPLVTFDDLDRWRQSLSAVYPRIKAAHENDEFVVVSQEDIALLSNLLRDVQSSRTTLRQHQRSLNLIIASVKDTDPSQQTLEAAMAARQAERDAAYLDQLAKSKQAAADAVDAEYAAKIAEEQRQQRDILNKQRLQAAELQTQQKQKELDRIAAEAEEVRKAREKAALLQEFNRERAAIESLLAPFLDLAITQPSGTNPISKGGIRRQTSLGALRSSGALNDTRAGLDFLYHVGGHPANMRKKGGFPSFVSMSPIPNESVRQQVRRAQQLLVKYGELLVEKGMLSE